MMILPSMPPAEAFRFPRLIVTDAGQADHRFDQAETPYPQTDILEVLGQSDYTDITTF
jgi:hypothetical protein